MKYIYIKTGDVVDYICAALDEAQVIESETNPAKEYREGYEAVLDYNEEEGVHWEYVLLPTEPAGVGFDWVLRKVDGVWTFVKQERPLTEAERLDKVEDEIDKQKYAWKVGEAVNVGDRRYYKEHWYICLQAHTTQADWTPDIVPALWQVEE